MAKKQKQDPKQKQEAQRFLSKVPEEHVFYCQDGRILKDMKELGEALAVMADETFAYHANTEKKDFGNWASGHNRRQNAGKGTCKKRRTELKRP